MREGEILIHTLPQLAYHEVPLTQQPAVKDLLNPRRLLKTQWGFVMAASSTCVQAEIGVQFSWPGPSRNKTDMFVFYLHYCEVISVKRGAPYTETSLEQEALTLPVICLVF